MAGDIVGSSSPPRQLPSRQVRAPCYGRVGTAAALHTILPRLQVVGCTGELPFEFHLAPHTCLLITALFRPTYTALWVLASYSNASINTICIGDTA